MDCSGGRNRSTSRLLREPCRQRKSDGRNNWQIARTQNRVEARSLDEAMLDQAITAFAMMPQPQDPPEQSEALSHYMAGVGFIAKTDVFLQFEVQAYGSFLAAATAIFRLYRDDMGDRFPTDVPGFLSFIKIDEAFKSKARGHNRPIRFTKLAARRYHSRRGRRDQECLRRFVQACAQQSRSSQSQWPRVEPAKRSSIYSPGLSGP